MKRLAKRDEDLGVALTTEAARRLTNQLGERLRPAIAALDAESSPSQELPYVRPVKIILDGQAVLELTTREALDLHFAFKQLLEERATGTAEHTHVHAEDYSD